MTTQQLRDTFLNFFKEHDHLIRPSVPLLSPDPTTLFTSAGMQPYMDAFCGLQPPPAPRVASCQKCVRTSDIELIGHTARHESFFEMLGNFSFGDYFKQPAIELAWELFVDVLGLPQDDLWITVYEDDDEAADIWRKRIGVPRERITRLGRGDNWWPKERWDGPCGPCSEIYIDLGPAYACDNPNCKPGCDGNELCDRYFELWNLVFPMYTESEDGELTPLPSPGIDTGLGLERMAMVMQPEARTVYETDETGPILRYLLQLAGDARELPVEYGADSDTDLAARIITDHTRAVAFLIADGVMPSNEGAGYVLRRFIRRAYSYGRRLGLREPFIHKAIPLLSRTMGETYPDLKSREDFAVRVIKGEEERFGQTLDRGMELLGDVLARVERAGEKLLPGRDAFELYATYGFPLDMTRELAAERGVSVDEAGFEAAMQEHATISASMAGLREHGDVSASLDLPATSFVGYETLESEARVLALLKDDEPVDEAGEGETLEIVLDRTPFYAERGGQAGDSGALDSEDAHVDVETTYPWRETISVHNGTITRGTLRVGGTVTARVDAARRAAIERNHTATHLLHHALRQVLGEHAMQSGSIVRDDYLTFDFTHFEAVDDAALARIEDQVNAHVVQDVPVEAVVMPYDEAIAQGAIALFGEKYTEDVRMLKVGDFSRELCGGTHVHRTGEIGLIRITGESSVAAGTRRIRAISGLVAAERARKDSELLAAAARSLNCPPEQLLERIEAQKQAMADLRKSMEQARHAAPTLDIGQLVTGAATVAGVPLVAAHVPDVDMAALRTAADRVLEKLQSGVALLATVTDGGVRLVAKASDDVAARGAHAGKLVAEAAAVCGGRGGGKPTFAQAGAKDASKLDEALAKTAQILEGQLGN